MLRRLFALGIPAIVAAACLTGCTETGDGQPEEGSKEASKTESSKTESPKMEEGDGAPSEKETPKEEVKPVAPSAALKDPSLATEKAPDIYKVKMKTTRGDFVIEVHRDWAPQGADRFYNLVKAGYYTDVAFFRVIKGFMAQFGIHGEPEVSAKWREANIQDDPVRPDVSNTRGYVSFAKGGPNSRTTQLFINFVDKNAQLDAMGFPPIGKVIEGMDVVDSLYDGYGEGAPRGLGPRQDRIQFEGNKYLKESFPKLDYIESATVVE